MQSGAQQAARRFYMGTGTCPRIGELRHFGPMGDFGSAHRRVSSIIWQARSAPHALRSLLLRDGAHERAAVSSMLSSAASASPWCACFVASAAVHPPTWHTAKHLNQVHRISLQLAAPSHTFEG